MLTVDYPSIHSDKYISVKYYYSNKKKDYVRSKTKYCSPFDVGIQAEICLIKPKLCSTCNIHNVSRTKKKKNCKEFIKQCIIDT